MEGKLQLDMKLGFSFQTLEVLSFKIRFNEDQRIYIKYCSVLLATEENKF